MLVSHESPLALLEKSREYNDYDYCLVHLLPEYPEYLKFFKDSKAMGRRILLDNSLFELGKAFEPNAFAKWINELQPYEYVVPDVFSNSIGTIESFKNWQVEFAPKVSGKMMGVVQGETYQEMVDCYRFMSQNADKIAINFISSYFARRGFSIEPNATQWHILMNGRQSFVQDLIRDQIWDWDKPHHLLGCTLPQEFGFYNTNQQFRPYVVNNIESIDTSNPVVAGLHKTRYNEHGLDDKLTAKLADLLEVGVSPRQWDIINFNINKFREINHIQRSV